MMCSQTHTDRLNTLLMCTLWGFGSYSRLKCFVLSVVDRSGASSYVFGLDAQIANHMLDTREGENVFLCLMHELTVI